jgi:hypothetical protein
MIARLVFLKGNTRVVETKSYERDQPSYTIEHSRRKDRLGFPIWEEIATYSSQLDSSAEGKAAAMYAILSELPKLVHEPEVSTLPAKGGAA